MRASLTTATAHRYDRHHTYEPQLNNNSQHKHEPQHHNSPNTKSPNTTTQKPQLTEMTKTEYNSKFELTDQQLYRINYLTKFELTEFELN